MFMNKSKVTRDDVLKRMAQNEQMEHKVIENFQKEVGERMIEEQNKANKTTKGRRVPKSRQQEVTAEQIAVKILQETIEKEE